MVVFCSHAVAQLPRITPLELLSDTVPGPEDGIHHYEARVFDDAYVLFGAGGFQKALWRSDGSPAGTYPIGLPSPWRFVETLGTRASTSHYFFFARRTGDLSSSLWGSDGTTTGTRLLLQGDLIDIRFAWGSLVGHSLIFYKDLLQGRQYWISDGTPQGTMPLEIDSPAVELFPYGYYNGGFLFGRTESNGETSMLFGDGTIAGTRLFKTLPAGISMAVAKSGANSIHHYCLYSQDPDLQCELRITDFDSIDEFVVNVPGQFWGLLQDHVIHGLWNEVTETTTLGSTRIDNGTTSPLLSWPDPYLSAYGLWIGDDFLLLAKPGSSHDYEGLYLTDGTPEGTTEILPCMEAPCGRPNYNPWLHQGKIWFWGEQAASEGHRLFASEGTAETTTAISPPCPSCLLRAYRLDYPRGQNSWDYEGRRLFQLSPQAQETGQTVESKFMLLEPDTSDLVDLGTLTHPTNPAQWLLGDRLFFLTTSEAHGREPHALGLLFKSPVTDDFESGEFSRWSRRQ